MGPEPATKCAQCGAPFFCGRDDPNGCWCAGVPPLDPTRYVRSAGCLCEKCLSALVNDPGAQRLR